jgi:hypothetical protein
MIPSEAKPELPLAATVVTGATRTTRRRAQDSWTDSELIRSTTD